MKKRVLGDLLFLCLFVVLFAVPVQADWPEKPVKLIVAYGAGGGSDITARLLAQGLEKVIGQPVVVVNMTGGAGWVGWGAIAGAKTDGYTIGYINVPNLFAGYLDSRIKRSENLGSFTLIMNHITDPCVWAVRADSPYKTLADLMGAIRKSPGQLSIAVHGNGGDDHLAYLDMERKAGIKMKVVHNNSTAISRAQLLGGHVDVLAANVCEVFQQHQRGELIVLGVMADRRSPFLPDVATFRERGFDLAWASTRGIAAPAGLPDRIAARLSDALARVIESSEHRAKAGQLGLTLDVVYGAKYREMVQREEQHIKTLMGW